MTDRPDIDITFRGVVPREEILARARSIRSVVARMGASPRRVQILVERAPDARDVRAYVLVGEGPDQLRARGKHPDPLCALHLAAASLARRLAGPIVQVLHRRSSGHARSALARAS
jgi:hypothetical protein